MKANGKGLRAMARILIVDDSLAMRMMLKIILESAGHEIVAEAGDGMRAVIEYCKHKPDLVTMDMNMSGTGGLEAIEQLIQIDPEVLILVVSALATKQMILDAMKLGAKNFLLKPFHENQIISVVDMVLREYRPANKEPKENPIFVSVG
jgi:two-component system chemotaxis response regulator CheY